MASAKVIFCVSSRVARSRFVAAAELVGVTLIAQTVTQVRSSELSASGWILAALILLGAGCLLLGLVTPVTAILIGLISATFAFDVDIVVLSAVIALLGPGAFSIDARMFGHREILIPNASRSPKPEDTTSLSLCQAHSSQRVHKNCSAGVLKLK